MIAAIVCVAVAGAMILSLTRLAALRRQEVRTQAWELQAQWLAESGLERAAARLAADPQYAGETWRLSAADLGGADGAVVTIVVRPQERAIRAAAEYPDDPVRRVRRSRETTY